MKIVICKFWKEGKCLYGKDIKGVSNKICSLNCSEYKREEREIGVIHGKVKVGKEIEAKTELEMPQIGPGGLLHKLILSFGFRPVMGCGCSAFAKKMNEWGYFGCLQHKEEIVEWLVLQAKKAEVKLSSETVSGLLFTALRESVSSDKNIIQSKP